MANPHIEISVNGETQNVDDEQSLLQLIDASGFGEQRIAAALNGEFIPRHAYADTTISAGDKVDIVSPIAGG